MIIHRVRFSALAALYHSSDTNPPWLEFSWSVVGVSVGVCCWHHKSDPGDKSGPISSTSFAKVLWHFTETMVNCCFEKLFGVFKPMNC